MSIQSKIPKSFYKLFNSKYMEYYQLVLTAIGQETAQSYSLLGMTEEECQEIINEKIAAFTMDWSQEQIEDEGELLTRSNMASVMLKRLVEWGWLKKDYDEQLNQYVVSFPDYSQMYVDVFQKLFREEGGQERESILAVYSHLFTYSADPEKNNEILKSALQTSRGLLQMLVNMQEGIRGYFEALSEKKTFLGVQEVLVNEINNTDSQKYAILTTTDSFYRYKEAVKELIERNMTENGERKQALIEKRTGLEKGSASWRQNDKGISSCEEAMHILLLLNREFDSIERRYNRLIDQKRIFAKRAAARIRYIWVEGDVEEDRTKALVKLLNDSERREEILQRLGQGYKMTEKLQIVKEKSFAKPRNAGKREFEPQQVARQALVSDEMGDFVVKPLYTRSQLDSFMRENEKDGVFRAEKGTVRTVEDLEKLLFVWQEATEISGNDVEIGMEEEITTAEGLTYSGFSIRKK